MWGNLLFPDCVLNVYRYTYQRKFSGKLPIYELLGSRRGIVVRSSSSRSSTSSSSSSRSSSRSTSSSSSRY